MSYVGTSVQLHLYECFLLNSRHRKCFRANLFKLAEDHLAHKRQPRDVGEALENVDGIHVRGWDVHVRLVFESREYVLKFQSAVLTQAASVTPNKRPLYSASAKAETEEGAQGGDAMTVSIASESVSSVPATRSLTRVFRFEYNHNQAATDKSPDCDTVSDAHSLSVFSAEPETVTIMEAETRVQMLEDHTHEFFHGKNPEVAHIKAKAQCEEGEAKDTNNRLYLSRHLHEAFDGINTVPAKCPIFGIKYSSHDAGAVDCPQFGCDAVIAVRFKKRHRTVVVVEFRSEAFAADYSKYLRSGAKQLDSTKYELELYFDDPEKAKSYLEWKWIKCCEKWHV